MSDCVCGLDVCTDCDVCDDCVKLCDCNVCECINDSKCNYCINLDTQQKMDYLRYIRIEGNYLCDIKELDDIAFIESFLSKDGYNKFVFIKSVNNNVTVIVYDYARCNVKVYDLKDFKLSDNF